jgi:hypothetical protein
LVNTAIGDQRYHRCMPSDGPPGPVPPDPRQHWASAVSNSSAQPLGAPPGAFGRPARWPTFTALAIALVALAVGIAALFRSTPHNDHASPTPTYTQQQIADAKAKVCAAVGKFNLAVSVGNSLPKSSDALVTDLNSRQIFDVFSRLFLATLTEEPATPADLATAVREQASALEEAVIAYQDGHGISDPEMRPILDASSAAADKTQQLCK